MANDQQFCLRWNNHQSTLISVFDSLLENETLVDCTLAAEGQSLKAHKVVLSACSPYLESLLSKHYEKHPILILKDVKFTELKSMMDYMYRGEVNICQDQLGTFLKAAESLQIKGLSDNGDEAVGTSSAAPKKDPPRPSVTQTTRTPVESKRPAPPGDSSDASRDGSISPSSLRKRRRTRRPSQGDEVNHLDSNCDTAQTAPIVPAVTVPAPVKQIVKQEPNLSINETGLKKEIIEPPNEPLLEPKTEYLDYMNNENSIEVEDLTLDDDDDLDSSMDASRPGPSHGDMSNQGYPAWPMGDQSGTDEIFMAAQEAVGAATGQQQRDSQGFVRPVGVTTPLRAAKLKGIDQRQNEEKKFKRARRSDGSEKVNEKSSPNAPETVSSEDGKLFSQNGKKLGPYFMKKRTTCLKCNNLVYIKSLRIHSKYYCGVQPDEREWKLCGRQCLCKKCGTLQDPNAIEFHVNYLCKMKPIAIQCFYCPRIFSDYRGLLTHIGNVHGKKHKYLDLISILPKADPISSDRPQKVVKNHFNISTTAGEESFVEASPDSKLRLRQKTTLKCEKCKKELIGIHAFENHVNTLCESADNYYSCFFCEFQAGFAYQVLDHMEDFHDKYFNTFDLLQAKNTGIIPIVRNPEVEIDFADQNLYEPYVSPSLILPVKKRIKVEPQPREKKLKIQPVSAKVKNYENHYPSCSKVEDDEISVQLGEKEPNHFVTCDNTEDNEVIVQIGEKVKIRKNRKTKIPLQIAVEPTEVKPFKIRPTLKLGFAHRRFKPRRQLFIKPKCPAKFLPCDLCQRPFHQDSVRTHRKYHCGREEVEYLWELKASGKAFCKKCKTLQSARSIDFHVKYNCNQKNYSVQCFYCPKINTTYRGLLNHMRMGHNKTHYFEDLMTILPQRETLPRGENSSTEFSSNLVFHPFIFEPPIKNEQDDPTMFRFPSGRDMYSCFYCNFQHVAVFGVLDHMEEKHQKSHKLYDVLQAELVKETEKKE